jgi:hypothetical protein
MDTPAKLRAVTAIFVPEIARLCSDFCDELDYANWFSSAGVKRLRQVPLIQYQNSSVN